MDFPFLKNDDNFPYCENVNVYGQYKNTFDYSRWQPGVIVRLVDFPVDYENNVIFEDETARDAYFAEHSIFQSQLKTQYYSVINESIKLPLPFDYINRCRYLVVTLPVATSTTAPIDYETVNGVRTYCYYVDSCTYRAPSTTEVKLSLDYFQTYIYRCGIQSMMLERGHYPVAKTSVEEFLENPLKNNTYLTTPDVSYGDFERCGSFQSYVINRNEEGVGEMYCVIAITGDLYDTWEVWKGEHPVIPYAGADVNVGMIQPCSYYAAPVEDMHYFLRELNEYIPQAIAAIKGVFYVNRFELGNLEACHMKNINVTYYRVTSNPPLISIFQLLNREQFKLHKNLYSYDPKIWDYAKLYTYPYARLDIYFNNQKYVVKPQELSDNIDINGGLNMAFPSVTRVYHISGIGDNLVSGVRFNINREALSLQGGRWYDYQFKQSVPMFNFAQSGFANSMWAYHYAYEHNQFAYNTAYESAAASADLAQTNANNSAQIARQNSTNTVSNMTANNAVAVSANNLIVSQTQNSNTQGVAVSNEKIDQDRISDMLFSYASLDADIANYAVAASNNGATFENANTTNIISSLASALTGPISAITSGITSFMNNGLQFQTTANTIDVSLTNSATLYNAAQKCALEKYHNSRDANNSLNNLNNALLRSNTTVSNNLANTQTSNNADLINTNATNDYNLTTTNASNAYNTAIANANRTRSVATDSNNAALFNYGIQPPAMYGSVSNVDDVNVLPCQFEFNIVTQSKNALMQAASQFARYGYTLNQWVNFENWQMMNFFTYWRISDIIFTSETELTKDAIYEIKNLFKNGITLWSEPNQIGKVDIWKN